MDQYSGFNHAKNEYDRDDNTEFLSERYEG